MKKGLFILAALAFCLLLNGHAWGKSGLVPCELAQKAAVQKAKAVWGNAALGPYETYYGLDGLPAVHVYTFLLGNHAGFAEKEIYEQMEKGSAEMGKYLVLNEPAGLKNAQKTKIGEEVFGMIMVSARYESGPVIMH